MSGRVTTYGMEIALEDKYKLSKGAFERLLAESVKEAEEASTELEEVKRKIKRENLIYDSL